MTNNQNRIFGYDLIKAIAIFMIVFYHVGGLDFGTIIPGKYYLPNFNKIITILCSAGVPLFFMVNGALVIHKNLSSKQMILKALYLLLLLFLGKFVLQYLISYLLLSIRENMVHFWFLGTLAIVYLVSILLKKNIYLRYSVLAFLFLIPFCYNLFWVFYLYFVPAFNSFNPTHTGFFTLYAILYYYVGDYVRNLRISPLMSLGMILFGFMFIVFDVVVISNRSFVIYDGVNSSFPTFGALLMSSGIFLLFKDVTSQENVLRRLISFVGRNTMGIYLFHVLIIFILRKCWPGVFYDMNLIVALLISSFFILFTAFVSDLIKSSKYSWVLKCYFNNNFV